MTSSADLTAILEDLSAGRIDAAEAARRIDALPPAISPTPTPTASGDAVREPTTDELRGRPQADAWASATDRPQYATHRTDDLHPPRAPEPDAEAAAAHDLPQDGHTEPRPTSQQRRVHTGGVERISVRAVGRRVRIVGETAVATLSADGPHVLRRNGSVLEVSSDGELGSPLDGFSLLKAPRSLDEFRSLGLGKELLLRVNPNITVDVEVTAGSLNTERVPHLGKVRVTAGGAKLLDVTEINDALVQAGSATIKGSIRTGRSRVRAESGSLNIQLADDSNVTVSSDAQLGKVSWSGGHDGHGDEVVMGNGSAKLDIEVVMGHAQIRVGSDRAAEDLR